MQNIKPKITQNKEGIDSGNYTQEGQPLDGGNRTV